MRQWHKCSLPIVICLAALLLSGCFSARQAPPSAAVREVTDKTGQAVKVPLKPGRIVSLSTGTDELLIALVAPERIAALTYLSEDEGISNIVEQAKRVPVKIKASAESVIALQPDLVLMPDWLPPLLSQVLRDTGLTVYVYETPSTISQVKKTVTELAFVLGEEETGAKTIAGMDAELTAVAEVLKQVPEQERITALQFSLMGGSGGAGSSFDDICRYAGVKNGAALAGLGMNEIMSKEQIMRINPALLILPTWDYTGKTNLAQFKQGIEQDPAFQSVTAVKTGRLVSIPERYLLCSSQNMVYGVRELAKAAYPGYFGK